MGTRNLTMAINKEGETKVAQYGQWDGDPGGQGSTVLSFLQSTDLDAFEKRINELEFLTDDEIKAIDDDPNWIQNYPHLSRNQAGEILNILMTNIAKSRDYVNGEWETYEKNNKVDKLQDDSNFAADSLFCEWAYVIDLGKRTLEVYRGFNQLPLGEDDRFFSLFDANANPHREEPYYPVKLLKSYSLDELPNDNIFCEELSKLAEERYENERA